MPWQLHDCHTADARYRFARAATFLWQPKVINQATYLGAAGIFGPWCRIRRTSCRRNLTPAEPDVPKAVETFAEFLHIMKTGEDLDHLHPKLLRNRHEKLLPKSLPFEMQIFYRSCRGGSSRDDRPRAAGNYEYLSAKPCWQDLPPERLAQ